MRDRNSRRVPKAIRRIIWYYIRKDSCKIQREGVFLEGGGKGLPIVSIAKLGSEVKGKGKRTVQRPLQRPCEEKKKLCANFCFSCK